MPAFTPARIVALIALLFPLAAAAQDCSRPRTNTERLICSNDRVSEAHERMAVAFFMVYRRAMSDELRGRIRAEQRQWETGVRDACMDVPCLLRSYEERTLALDQSGE
jgi:uncharacterized protein